MTSSIPSFSELIDSIQCDSDPRMWSQPQSFLSPTSVSYYNPTPPSPTFALSFPQCIQMTTKSPTSLRKFSCQTSVDNRQQQNELARLFQEFKDMKPMHRLTCDLCPYSTFDRSNMRKHQRAHSGLKPYGCSLCKATFSYRSSYTRHLRSVHGTKDLASKPPFKWHSQDTTIHSEK